MGGNVDPCLYVKKSDIGIVSVALYKDHNLTMCNIETIDYAIAALKENGLVLKVVERLLDYLSCEVKFLANKKRALLVQPHLIENLVKKFGEQVRNIFSNKTPDMS